MANDQCTTTNGFSIIGKPTAMVDAAGKTTGAGKYADDLSLPGMLIGKNSAFALSARPLMKRSIPLAPRSSKAWLRSSSGKDAPNAYGILPVGHDEHALATDKVRYVGDNVACVIAVDEATAEKALELIDVEYEVLPAYFDPEESMKARVGLHPRKQAAQSRERLSPRLRRSRQSSCRSRLRG